MTTTDDHCWRQGLLVVLAVSSMLIRPVLTRPHAFRVSEDIQVVDKRWDESRETRDTPVLRDDQTLLLDIARSFRTSKSLNLAVIEVLKTLTEDELITLERTLGTDGEIPQADMPMEDLVEDSPQELPGEDGAEDLAGYRGELLILDGVNSSIPSPINSTEEPLYPQLQKINREKLKEIRLAAIKNQIMNILWPVGTPPSFANNATKPQQASLIKALADKMKMQKAFTPGDVYTEKIQSFYPSCDIPRNTDAELWNESQGMNLLFELSYPTTIQGTQVNIVAAKLRLYKLSQGNVSTTAESCPPPESEDLPSAESSGKQQFSTSSGFSDEKMIRVSIYWYTRSLKKHRVKRKLLDSQMLSVYGESWTEWNIRGAVKAWRDNRRNFGLLVEVEDEDGALLPTDKYFTAMNCSQEASTSRPFPGFLVARAFAADSTSHSTNHSLGQSLHLDTLLFPMIDLCTIEFPESEKPDAVFYHKVADHPSIGIRKTEFKLPHKDQNATAVSNVQLSTASNAEKHKIRHHSHKHTGETLNSNNPPHRHVETVRRDDGDSIEEITWTDDLDGHQLRKHIIVQKVIMKSQNNEQENDR